MFAPKTVFAGCYPMDAIVKVSTKKLSLNLKFTAVNYLGYRVLKRKKYCFALSEGCWFLDFTISFLENVRVKSPEPLKCL